MYGLRELNKEDIITINKWKNDLKLIFEPETFFGFINIEINEKWYDGYMPNRGNTILCAIVEEENDKILGVASLVSVDYVNQSAELGIVINEKQNATKDLVTFGVRAMLEHAFFNMNLWRVELTTLEENMKVRDLYERVGFVQEGLKRRAKFLNGKYVDMISYSILKEEYVSKDPAIVWRNEISKYSFKLIHSSVEKEWVISCCEGAFANPITKRKEYRQLFEKWNAAADFVVVYNQNILGFAILYNNNFDTHVSYLAEIVVSLKYQNMHIGKALLMECEMLAKNHNMNAIKLEVQSNNIKAIKFYKRNGYKETKYGINSIYMYL